MKAALNQAAIPGSTGNQDTTDGNISSDIKAILSFGSNATANDTAAAHGVMSIGFSDFTNHGSISWRNTDAANPSSVFSLGDDSFAYILTQPGSAASNAEFTASSLSNGARLNWADIESSQLVNHLLLSGSDIVCKVHAVTLNGTTPVTVTHNLGAAPKGLIATSHTAADASSGAGRWTYGFWSDESGGTYASMSGAQTNGATTTACFHRVNNNRILAEHASSSPVYGVTVSNVGATTFDVVADAATTDQIYILAITGVTVKVGIAAATTGTGASNLITSVTGTPIVGLFGLTRHTTTVGSSNTGAGAGFAGLGVAVNNNGTIQQAMSCLTSEDNRDTTTNNTEENSYTHNTRALVVRAQDGTADWEAEVTALGSNIAITTHDAAAAAYHVPYMLLSTTVAAPSFSVAPSVTSETATAYTIGFTPSASSTIYGVAVRVGSGAPSEAQIKAGQDSAGATALAANSKAVTGADTLVLTPGASPPAPYADLYFVLNNAGGDSAVASALEKYLDAPTGYQFKEVDDLTPPGGSLSLLTDLSPAAALGDVLKVDLEDRQEGGALTVDGDGTVLNDYTGPNWWYFAYDRYDLSTGLWDGEGFIYVGTSAPVLDTPPPVMTLELNEAMTPVDIRDFYTEPQGLACTHAIVSGALATGLSMDANGVISGTPTVDGEEFEAVSRVTNAAGQTLDIPLAGSVRDTATVPNVEYPHANGASEATAQAAIEAADLVYNSANTNFQFSETVPAGAVIDQEPEAGAPDILAGTEVVLVISLGVEPPTSLVGDDLLSFGLGFGF